METVLVTAPLKNSMAAYHEALGGKCDLLFLTELAGQARQHALKTASILVSGHVRNELLVEEAAQLEHVRFIQLLHAGTDHIPFSMLPKVPTACSRGKGAVEMSEHIAALALACSRRLLVENRNMRAGKFNTYAHGPRKLSGGICGILGFGGAGQAAARIFRTMGMSIHAINRSGKTDQDVDFIGTIDDLESILRCADVIVVSLALTATTKETIGARQLAWTKPNAILVNVSRAEIIDEAALYHHLVANPRFSAGLDVWWIEPFRHGEFRTNYPFLELGNVVASPHNSAQADNSDLGLAQALRNIQDVLAGNPPQMLVNDDEKII